MQAVMIKILSEMFWKLLTYKLVGGVIVELLKKAADYTESDVDDKIVDMVEKALFP